MNDDILQTVWGWIHDPHNPFFGLVARDENGRALGLMPVVKVFTADDLVAALRNSGFEIAHRWHPGRGKAVFRDQKSQIFFKGIEGALSGLVGSNLERIFLMEGHQIS